MWGENTTDVQLSQTSNTKHTQVSFWEQLPDIRARCILFFRLTSIQISHLELLFLT